MTSRPSVDVVIPVLNEERDLPRCVATLREFLGRNLQNPWRIVIADNGSDDRTPEVARELAQAYPEVASLRIEERGRGRALRRAWLESQADFVSYMDVDLSTDVSAFPLLVRALEEGYDLAIGSRLAGGAQVRGRTLQREVVSRCYNLLIKAMFFTRFSDAQCGFKALTRRAAQALVPHVKDQHWFFDTELLILAEKRGFRIKDVPVTWTDDPDTRVKVLKTSWNDLKGLLRLRFGGLPEVERPEGG
ncbi:MAG: glycosyltransferase family 2 protein [Chloroflexi bacterium]|nr:glycosyltransferase family 2 protein [Chloroflexota bacterium]